MSSRTNIRPYSVITNGVMTANITSLVTILQSVTGVSYALSWSGTSPVGTASVQVSNDYSLNPNGSVRNSGTWTTVYINVNGVPAASAPITGNTGTGFIDVEKTMAYAIRLIFTFASGTGTLNAVINGKVS